VSRARRRAGRLGLGGFLLGLCLLAACSHPSPFALTNITGLMPPLQFNLRDGDDRPVSARDYQGKVVLLYFGYTHCPDVCPTTLAMLSQAVRALGTDASQVRVLFVSVDPQRDTAPLLKRYVNYFGPQFVGLSGPDGALLPLTRRYRVAYHRDPPDHDGNYAVEHSSAIFVFDQRGRARLLASSSADYAPMAVAADLRRLIAAG
jgi:protein SCO1/2